MTALSSVPDLWAKHPQNQWRQATKADYVAWRANPSPEPIQLAFNEGQQIVDLAPGTP